MNEDVFTTIGEPTEPEEDATVITVRLTRSYWHDPDGAYQRISLKYLKRRCKGFNIFDDDCSMVGAEDVIPRIVNLEECEAGLYELVPCNENRDYFTGTIEEWDYHLVPVSIN